MNATMKYTANCIPILNIAHMHFPYMSIWHDNHHDNHLFLIAAPLKNFRDLLLINGTLFWFIYSMYLSEISLYFDLMFLFNYSFINSFQLICSFDVKCVYRKRIQFYSTILMIYMEISNICHIYHNIFCLKYIFSWPSKKVQHVLWQTKRLCVLYL